MNPSLSKEIVANPGKGAAVITLVMRIVVMTLAERIVGIKIEGGTAVMNLVREVFIIPGRDPAVMNTRGLRRAV